ncbi:MAG: tetratricopeptide repeat protein [Nitrospirota bacterium]
MSTETLRSKLYALRWVELMVIAGIVLLYGWSTYGRNFVWKDDLSLWSDIVKKSPNKARVYNYLGLAYHKVGDIDNAILQYKKGLSLNPFEIEAHINIGVSYFYKGLVDKAITHFKYVIEINPDNADAHYNLGIAYGSKGEYDLAYEEIRKGIELYKR